MRILLALLAVTGTWLLVGCEPEAGDDGVVIIPRETRDAAPGGDGESCGQGRACEGETSGGGEPCLQHGDCQSGECGRVPGGYCVVACQSDAECGPGTGCTRGPDGRQQCLQLCIGQRDCRPGWICATDGSGANFCRPSCSEVGCPAGEGCVAATGLCAPLSCIPEEERCDELDNDCDGAVDEKLRNPCGGCGAAPRETCNGRDDDCDGATDEGVTNACGACGAPPSEACNGRDDDCDGRADEAATCADGSRCSAGRCAGRAGPAGPCSGNADCASGDCILDLPGGFCVQPCNRDADCGGDPCLEVGNGERWCLAGCAQNNDCRNGWICDEGGVCLPHCGQTGCDESTVCDPSGRCIEATYTVRMGAVTIRPYIESDKTMWDGLEAATQEEILELARQVALALGAPAPLVRILEVLANLLFAETEPPDAFGTAELSVDGRSLGTFDLPVVDNQYRPTWRGVQWSGVPISAGSNVRLTLFLMDEDNAFDDQIGQVVVGAADWAQAAAQRAPVQANTSGLGSRNILFVEIEAILER